MENSTNNTNIHGSTIGVVSTGNKASIEKIRVEVTQDSASSSQKVNDPQKVIDQLKKEIESSQLPDYKKTDALNNIAGIEKELAKTEQPEKQEGVKHFLKKLNELVENIKPLSDLVTSLMSLLHLTL